MSWLTLTENQFSCFIATSAELEGHLHLLMVLKLHFLHLLVTVL